VSEGSGSSCRKSESERERVRQRAKEISNVGVHRKADPGMAALNMLCERALPATEPRSQSKWSPQRTRQGLLGGQLMRPAPKEVVVVVCVFVGGGGLEQPLNGSRAGAEA
jgi:hypothetical protein